MMDYMKL
ncbi:hypothetical protein CICLE_v100307001mg, partial [Citrus x clementina]